MGMRFWLAIMASVSMLLTGCQQQEPEKPREIRVGVIAGPETVLMETVKKIAKEKYGLNIKIVEFNDYNMPNVALSDAAIDANVFQHQPFLEHSILKDSFDLIPLGRTFIYPMGIYSKHYKNIADLPEGAVVAIPNDPSNQARALLLLAKSGLITLKSNVNIFATPMDIIQNPKKIVVKPIDAALLARELPNVALAIINTNFALSAHLLPHRDGLVLEGAETFYANVIAVRTPDKNNPDLQKLIAAFQSPEVVTTAESLFQGQAIPAWITPPPK
jgi:D-methionine transport system substrate-binding protein